MGYTLMIGEAEMEYDKEYNSLKIIAKSQILDNAPAFNEPTDKSNERWPSYTQWRDFARFTGLEDLFFDKEFEGENSEVCLIRSHPGHTVICQFHKKKIDGAYEAFYKIYPNCKAGYSPKLDDNFVYDDPDWPVENNYAVRLEWLKFWVDWALENCKIPIFYNS